MHFLDTDTYLRLVAALAAVEPCIFTDDREAEIAEVLAEIGGIVADCGGETILREAA